MKKILIIRLSAIGDVILTSAAALNVKLSFPEAQIYLLTRHDIAELAPFFAGVDEVLEFPPHANFAQLFRMGEYLDSLHFDRIIDLHGSLRSKYLMRHLSAPVKVQYRKRRWERFAAVRLHRINHHPPHTIDLYNEAVRKCGGQIFARRPVMIATDHKKTKPNFENNRPTIVLAPGASYPTKQWPKERFKELAISCVEQLQGNVILLLTAGDMDMMSLKSVLSADRLKFYVNADFAELISVLSRSDVMVSNDSGLMHLSSAVGTPVVALFGPTHPTLGFSPRGRSDTIIQVDEACRPCSLHGRRKCYRDRQYCFERIKTADVLNILTMMLEHSTKINRALFIDRDGTLIKEKNFLDNPDDIEPEDKAFEAIRIANNLGYKVIVLSNQSGVARGYFDEQKVREINSRLLEIFRKQDAIIDDILYCPHYKGGRVVEYAIDCDCRKPADGMVATACDRHHINPHRSIVIGDKLADINLAAVIGGRGILVQTGYGKKSEAKLGHSFSPRPECIKSNMYEAVKYIIDNG
jgi:lipopolysaccharide heptosyltransferase II